MSHVTLSTLVNDIFMHALTLNFTVNGSGGRLLGKLGQSGVHSGGSLGASAGDIAGDNGHDSGLTGRCCALPAIVSYNCVPF